MAVKEGWIPLRNMLRAWMNCSDEKSPAAKNSGRRLVGDHGALEEVLKRESVRGVNEV
jgi:hypothetical protein